MIITTSFQVQELPLLFIHPSADHNDCPVNACHNDGICVDGNGTYSCQCVAWTTGMNCESRTLSVDTLQCLSLSLWELIANAMTLHTIFCCHFGAKNLQARFLQVDPFDWEHSSFFRCSSETFSFQSAHLLDASSQALLMIHHKKLPSSCVQTSGHDELRHWFPVISSPNFVFGQFRRQNAPLQTVMDKMHTMDSLLWATDTAKSKKKGSRNVHPGPKMRAKINIKIKKN